MSGKVLVIGHGPSYRNYEFIRNFDGLRLAADISALDLINHDIIPDYQMWSETSEGVRDFIDEFMPGEFIDMKECQVRKKMTVVYRSKVRPELVNRVGRFKMNSIVFDTDIYGNENAINNVGLYSIVFADEILKADEVHLIGLDMKGEDYLQSRFDSWIDAAKHYYRNKTSNMKIIDHSGGDFPEYKGKDYVY